MVPKVYTVPPSRYPVVVYIPSTLPEVRGLLFVLQEFEFKSTCLFLYNQVKLFSIILEILITRPRLFGARIPCITILFPLEVFSKIPL